MKLKFTIDRPKISDEEIKQRQNFEDLVEQFKKQSLKKAQGDETWWKNKKVQYSSVIAGTIVICTISYLTLFKNQSKKTTKHETLTTQQTNIGPETKKPKKLIEEPSKKLKLKYTIYTINNAKGGEIKHTTYSKIKIPKKTFVDKSGNDIIGDVTIEYKEFHDVGDVVLSGIPMAYDSVGNKFNFETAGMFDIKGSQKGEPVFIKAGKKVEVELASHNEENRFNQYYLDTVSKNWQYLKKDLALSKQLLASNNNGNIESVNKLNSERLIKKSPKLQELKNQIEVIIPKKIDSVKIVYVKKAGQLPKTKEPLKPAQPTKGRPTFKLDGSYDEFPELAAFDNVVFEVGTENVNYRKDMHEITWSDVKISQGPVKGKNYILNLTYRNQTEKLIVYPVLTGEDFDKAQKAYSQKFSDYELLVAKRKAEEKKLMDELEAKQQAYLAAIKKKQAEFEAEKTRLVSNFQLQAQNNLATSFGSLSNSVRATRLFSISQFGIFNSDCPHRIPSGTSVNPIFVLKETEKFVIPDFVYLINHDTKSVYQLRKEDGLVINYSLQNTYSLCLFKNNKMYICNKSTFKQLLETGSNKFLITGLPSESENLIDFKNALEI
jgi:hypothetical protein